MYVEVATSLETRKLNRLFTYEIPAELEIYIFSGQNIIVPFGKGNKETSAIVIKILPDDHKPDIEVKKIIRINSKKTDLDKKLLDLAVMIKDKYFLPLSSVLKLMTIRNINIKENYDNKNIFITEKGREKIISLRRSKKKELLELIEFEGKIPFLELIERNFKKSLILELIKTQDINFENKILISNKVELSHKQEEIFKDIKKGFNNKGNNVYLLFGATGSGKTEIYFKAIEETLQNNKQVIVLLPEINLTEQMISRFEKAFPDNVVKWHSQITIQQKKKAWEDLVKKEKNILIGPRSAIFTKMSDVGLIIVDEEHDISYYQQNFPNYNGRDVAIMRGEIEKAVVVLGSATPSVDSMQMANEGKFELLRLEDKFHGQADPKVHLIDMKAELHKGNSTIISDALDYGIRDKIKNGEQILIFINRRGYYNFLMCRDCGNVIKCNNCEIPLAYHEKERKLICHYCDYKIDTIISCPTCGSKRIRGIGLGTEQAVEIIKKKYPELIVERLDSDVRGGKARKKNIIQDYNDKKIHILVGTQIIAKGIDFPNVGLVGILLGDMSLNFPDFRAREWTFQLLMQVIGRTSRRDKKGEVILQTYRPSDIIYRDIENFDYNNFYLQELKFRRKHGYPPFGEIFRLQFIGQNREDLIELIWNSYHILKSKLEGCDIFEPKPNRIEKFNNYYRWQIVVKLDKVMMIKNEEYFKKFMENYYMDNNKKEMIYIERNPYGLI